MAAIEADNGTCAGIVNLMTWLATELQWPHEKTHCGISLQRLSLSPKDDQSRRVAVFRLSLSFRDSVELLAQRGIEVAYEAVRQWSLKFGQTYANALKRHRGRTGDTWHLDEVFLKINGKTHSLWRAVDQYGNVLDILVQSRRDKKAAKEA
jgi:transposase-like protein